MPRHRKIGRDGGKHIAIAVPAYSWSVSIATMRSLLWDCNALWRRGDRITFIDECGSTHLTVAKAMMFSRFLETDADCLFHIDNDVGWEPGALTRLVDYPVDFVGGVYRKRKDPVEWPVAYLPDRPELRADPETGLLEVAMVPGGFVCLTRKCVLEMRDAYKDLEFFISHAPGKSLPGFFEPMTVEGHWVSDDVAFCHRWRAIGGKVWTDPEIDMVHVGTKAFEGSLGAWLRGQYEKPA